MDTLEKYVLEKSNIFNPAFSLENVQRSPIRPLGEASNFLIDEMPAVIKEIKKSEEQSKVEKLSQTIDKLARPWISDMALLQFDPSATAIARLDSQMLKSGLIHSGGSPGQNLHLLTEILSVLCGQPDIITYKDIVRSNPSFDIRTFTAATLGHTEASFYILHEYVEQELDSIGIKLKKAIRLSNQSDSSLRLNAATILVQEAQGHFTNCLRYMGKFMAMKKEDFAIFREYLKGYQGLTGASGLFSAGMLILDSLLVGENLPQSYFNRVQDDLTRGYYPQQDQVYEAFRFAQERKSVTDCALRSTNSQLLESTAHFVKTVTSFRRVHYATVIDKIPEVAANRAPGTGLEADSGTFLQSRISLYDQIAQRLSSAVAEN